MNTLSPRIAIVAPLKQWGGLERKFTILCDEFLRMGVQPEIWRLRGEGDPFPDGLPEAVVQHDLGTRSKRDGILRVAELLRNNAPAALLTAKDHGAQTVMLARMLARTRVPVYIKATNMPSEIMRRPMQRFMARRLYPRANGVIAISRGVAEDVSRMLHVPASRVHLIYNPAITRDFDQRLHGPVEHPWLGPEPEYPVIIGAGRLTPQKDFLTLVDAFARLRQRSGCRLLILGEGEQRNAIEQRARELNVAVDVDLPGRVDDPVPYMRAASLFAFSSRYEGLGNVLVEAMATGTRLVSTDCPSGPREILEDGRYGRLVPPGDPAALADAMEAALQEPRPDPAVVAGAIERFRAPASARRYLEVMGVHSG